MISENNPTVTLTVVYHCKTFQPRRGVLFRLSVQASQVLNRVRSGYSFVPDYQKLQWK